MIKINIANLQNPTNNYSRGLALIPGILDTVAQKINTVITSKDVTIDLKLVVDPALQAGATGGSQYPGVFVKPGIQTIKGITATEIQEGRDDNGTAFDATITLSSAYLEKLETYGVLSSNPNAWPFTSILVHEFLHAMGISGFRDKTTGALTTGYQSTFDAHVVVKDGKPYFVGPNATSLLGAAIPLTELNGGSSIYHLDNDGSPAIPNDVLNPSFGRELEISDLDLAILKDLGYELSKMLVSADGRTYIPSVNADRINGVSSTDTVFYSGSKAAYRVDAIGNNTATVYNTRVASDADSLFGVERIKFADVTLAFDTNGAVGEVYRLYQGGV